jgi:D-alanine-D-alanine ligase
MNIALLTWWISTEREVALRSAENMKNWIEKAGHIPHVYDFPKEVGIFLWEYIKYDLVIPLFHGIYGEDGQVTAFLATLNIPYAYSDFSIHALCMDKNLTNLFLQNLDIKIPKTIFLRKWEAFELKDVPFPAIIKPNHGWSSIATYKVWKHDELADACISLPEEDDILIQECIEWREFTVGIYRDNVGYQSLPIIEIRTLSWDFFDYDEKYGTDGSNEVFLEWEEGLKKMLNEKSKRIAEYIGIKWVVRIDWRYDWNNIYFLEVNTIPGFTSGSLIPKMWKKAKKSEEEFLWILTN